MGKPFSQKYSLKKKKRRRKSTVWRHEALKCTTYVKNNKLNLKRKKMADCETTEANSANMSMSMIDDSSAFDFL